MASSLPFVASPDGLLRHATLLRIFCLGGLMLALMTPAAHSGEAVGEVAEKAASTIIDPHLAKNQDDYMNQQAAAGLALVGETLARFSPQLPEPAERKLALCLFDTVMHDVYAPRRAPARTFLAKQLSSAVASVESTRVSEGAMIWKFYNHGFVARTPTVTLAFDLIRTPPYLRDAAPEKPDVIDRLVAQCDVLFISHQHGDHADRFIAQAFLDAGKPVVAPSDLWQGEAIYSRITHLEREAHTVQKLPIHKGKQTLDLVIYPGHQQISETGTVLDNVCLVFSPEGISFCQTGDQSWMDDFKWIDTVGEHHRVDVLMANCWTADMPRMIKGMKPRLVIPGHENEMGHDIAGRIPFWRGYEAAKGVTTPVLFMLWGESYHYLPRKS